MKIDGNLGEADTSTLDSSVISNQSSERRPGTVVGFRPESARWSKWANRWVLAAIAQGALAAGLTAFLLYDAKYGTPGAAKIVAGGGAGTWLTVGYLGFIIFGPMAAAVTSLFYQHLESNLRAPYAGISNILAWLHLVLMNVGVTVATWIMWNGGWRAVNLSYSLQNVPNCLGNPNPIPPNCTSGYIAGQVHEQILGGLVDPIGYFCIIAVLGAFAGGIGYVLAWRHAPKA